MSIESKIIRDLQAGQSTADTIASRLNVATPVAEVILERLVKEGQLLALDAMGLRIYRLNPTT